jgi:hypothetical protein
LGNEVRFERAASYLDSEKARHLEAELGGKVPFHCWAMTDGNNKKYFVMMCPGDELLFTETGSGRFQWRGEVKTTFECEALGRELWPHRGQTGIQKSRHKPWKYIYVIEKLRPIRLDKRLVLTTFGIANPDYHLFHPHRVSDGTMNELISRFKTIDGILDTLRERLPT